MRTLIVDDEAPNRENLRELLKQYCPEVTVVAEADGVATGVVLTRKHEPELLLLDIKMQDGTGFDLLRQLNRADFEVVFITAYDHYGIEAIKFAVLDYLLKPVDIEELQSAIAKAGAKTREKHKNGRMEHLLQYLERNIHAPVTIPLPLLHETLYIPVDEIVRCEASNTYTYFYLASGERVLVSQTLKAYEALLEGHRFLRTHQSHLINPAFVRSWLKENCGALLLKDKTKVPVSKLNREKVKAALNRYPCW